MAEAVSPHKHEVIILKVIIIRL